MSSLLKAQEHAQTLAARLKQARARVQSIQARERVKEVKVARTADTRRKILIGAFVLAQGGTDVANLNLQGARLADYLKRDEDRALFGLPPAQPRNGPAAQEPQTRQG